MTIALQIYHRLAGEYATDPVMQRARTRPRRARMGKRRADMIIATVLALVVAVWVPNTRRLGDAFQVVLPVMALGCAVARGEAGEILARYAILEVGIKVPKAVLGEREINQRPAGGSGGFPSGHTAAATFGAAHLARNCAMLHPVTRGAVVLAAAFTGGSRIEAGKHTLWQTTAGALWGWGVALMPYAGGLVWRRLRRWRAVVWPRQADPGKT